jgi:hypothetical protein
MLYSRKKYYIDPPELVTNPGNPFLATTGWTPSSNSTASISAMRLRLTHTTASVKILNTPITCKIGMQYLVKSNIGARSLTGNAFMCVGTSAGNPNNILNKLISTDADPTSGGKDSLFTATQTTHYVGITSSSSALAGETIDIDYFSVKEYV